ncbi:Gfo/Idh/MocA family oxidoreductase [Jeotgalibaca sp. MA1X17-3]|uniref:Gfo/Idh/MocA family protein n=1 Tax=Jeotgalibaca sp. MA1X17-3 TaxID=2908211 RepID=UPI001F1B25D2|nr:Gfo/Idh/MocA family oxidoreductase [Jeotgalibaca sp. MA1X17-3]UJF15615.1 Gfo/Idh/MocA family oxidoreductase [Jeotgalibaca sp. MA1X17-3]
MLKIGVLGIGMISQKAYLPVMAMMQDEVEWHLSTRNKDVLHQVAAKYGMTHVHSTVESLLNSGIQAVFIHAATSVHYSLIKRFLEEGIHVYVDKPISEDIDETKELLELAEQRGVVLTCGFNRRFAPLVQQLKPIPNKEMIFIQKDRIQGKKESRYAIYDLFLHLVDVALFLLDHPVERMDSHIISEKGILKRAWMILETKQTSCVITMNYEAGANREIMEVQSNGGIHRVIDLNEIEILQEGTQRKITFPDWEPTLNKRGFAPLIHQFVESIHTGLNPVSPASALASHELCEKMLKNEQ